MSRIEIFDGWKEEYIEKEYVENINVKIKSYKYVKVKKSQF